LGRLTEILGTRVYRDSNIIVYAVEAFESYARTLQPLLSALAFGELTGVTRALSLAEVLVKPRRDKNRAIEQAYKRFLQNSSVFTVAPVSNPVLELAADIRATTDVKLPDAIHVATARLEGCTRLLTNDRVLCANFLNFAVSPSDLVLD
jgi:predicted nucleic acid-binding protein